MDQSKLETIVLEHADPLKDFLGLSDWKVYYEFKRIANGDWASCDSSQIDYQTATITIDLDGVVDDQQVIDTMFHELCHVLHAPFTFYRTISEGFAQPVNDQVLMVEKRSWNHAAEAFVIRMEWIWRNHLRSIYLEQFTRP